MSTFNPFLTIAGQLVNLNNIIQVKEDPSQTNKVVICFVNGTALTLLGSVKDVQEAITNHYRLR